MWIEVEKYDRKEIGGEKIPTIQQNWLYGNSVEASRQNQASWSLIYEDEG